jgi:hypothetical protein
MSLPNHAFTTIHPSAYRHGAGLLRWVAATRRRHGALRYQCPITGSFVLVTDEAALDELARPRARIRCLDCREMHLLIQDADAGNVNAIVAGPLKP